VIATNLRAKGQTLKTSKQRAGKDAAKKPQKRRKHSHHASADDTPLPAINLPVVVNDPTIKASPVRQTAHDVLHFFPKDGATPRTCIVCM
jgi:hypothetical protein